MNKHASEMTETEILDEVRVAIWAGGSEPFGYNVDMASLREVIKELKDHQEQQATAIAEKDAEVEALQDALTGSNEMLDVKDAEIERLRAQLDGVIAAVDAEPIPKLHSLNAMSVVETTISSIKERILAAKGES